MFEDMPGSRPHSGGFLPSAHPETGISVLVINTINSLEELSGEKLSVTLNEEEGLVDCRFLTQINEKSVLLMDSLILGLKGIKKQYGKEYLDLTFEEV